MKLIAETAGETHELYIKREGVRVTASVDGRQYEMEVREIADGNYLLMLDGRVYDCRVGRSNAQPERFEAHVRNRAYFVSIADPRKLGGAKASAAHEDGSAQIIAPMPGKVVRVLVEAGAAVEAGDGIVIVEAMKMQNELKSPKAGIVETLHARAGATVNAGEVLAIIE